MGSSISTTRFPSRSWARSGCGRRPTAPAISTTTPLRSPAGRRHLPRNPGALDFDGGRNDLHLIWPWQDRNRRFSWLKASTFALMLYPAIRSAYLFGIEDYGVVPLAGLTYWSGVWATVILLMALAVTPAVTIFRWPALIDVRRMIGVTALV